MKRIILFLLALTLVFSLFACNKSDKKAPADPTEQTPEDESPRYTGMLFDNEMTFFFNGKSATLSFTQMETFELDDGKLVGIVLIANATTAAAKNGNGFSIDLTADDSPYIVGLSAAGDGAEAYMAEQKALYLELVESDADKELVNVLFTGKSVHFYHDSALTTFLFDIVGYDITLIGDTQFRFDECRFADGTKVSFEYYESGNLKKETYYLVNGEVDHTVEHDDVSEN